jgi:hypothetical protein
MEEKIERLKKRLRLRNIIIGILSLLTLSSFVYSYTQMKRIKALELTQKFEQIASRTSELEQCKKDLFKALILAQKSADEASKEHQRAEEALKRISKK